MNTQEIQQERTADKDINFMGLRRVAMIISTFLILASITSLAIRGLNLGVDFTGGSVIEVGYPSSANVDDF